MAIEQAIRTALEYEGKVRDIYTTSARTTVDSTGRNVCGTLAQEESTHVRYLEGRLQEWLSSGRVVVEELVTAIPPRDRIVAGMRRIRAAARKRKPEPHHATDLQMLSRALGIEVEAMAFYKGIVRDLPPDERMMLEQFVRIEDGHVAIVQAEIDSITELGFWCDTREFALEAG